MGMKTPFISEIAPNTYAINEFGAAAEFLVIGEKKAVLIDTGVGLCDLPGIVRRFTDLPYDVVLTHGHLDHAGGMGHFTDLWLHEADFDMVRGLDMAELANYNKMLGENGGFNAYDYDPAAIRPVEQPPALHPLKEGDVLDLGGRTLTVIETPGHTAGSICLLDEKNRILFSGDACNVNLGLFGAPVAAALKGLEKLDALRDKFDQNFNGHLGYAGNPDCLAMAPHVLDDCIAICRAVLDGTAVTEEAMWFGGQKAKAVTLNGTRVSFPA